MLLIQYHKNEKWQVLALFSRPISLFRAPLIFLQYVLYFLAIFTEKGLILIYFLCLTRFHFKKVSEGIKCEEQQSDFVDFEVIVTFVVRYKKL